MHTQHAAAMSMLFMFAGGAIAQCPPQRLDSPSDFAGAFGNRLAMNDRHLIVGDWRDHTLCGDVFCANGYAWAYQRDAEGQWVFTQRIEPAGLGFSAGFGRAIALDGDRAIITRTLGVDCGGVPYIFEFDGEQWVETGQLCPPPGRGGQGYAVALHGNLALMTTVDENVLVYYEGPSGWELVLDLESPDSPSVISFFGASLQANQDWVMIGAPDERVESPNRGAVYIYQVLPAGQLELSGKLVPPDATDQPRFGESLALDGDTLVVGGYIADRDHTDQGAVYVFDLIDGEWTFQQELTHDDAERSDQLGWTVALDGDRLLAGAINDRTPTSLGAAYLFSRGTDGSWRQAAQLVPDEPAGLFGQWLALVDGTAAIGAPQTTGGIVDVFDLSCYLCRPDLDADGALSIFDFLVFFNAFDAGDPIADFDGDGELTLFDFLAFQTAFDAGCE